MRKCELQILFRQVTSMVHIRSVVNLSLSLLSEVFQSLEHSYYFLYFPFLMSIKIMKIFFLKLFEWLFNRETVSWLLLELRSTTSCLFRWLCSGRFLLKSTVNLVIKLLLFFPPHFILRMQELRYLWKSIIKASQINYVRLSCSLKAASKMFWNVVVSLASWILV